MNKNCKGNHGGIKQNQIVFVCFHLVGSKRSNLPPTKKFSDYVSCYAPDLQTLVPMTNYSSNNDDTQNLSFDGKT